MDLPELKPVESSKIKAVGYDPADEALFVQFKSDGSIWRYAKVTAAEYLDMIAAESIGNFHSKLARRANLVYRVVPADDIKP